MHVRASFHPRAASGLVAIFRACLSSGAKVASRRVEQSIATTTMGPSKIAAPSSLDLARIKGRSEHEAKLHAVAMDRLWALFCATADGPKWLDYDELPFPVAA